MTAGEVALARVVDDHLVWLQQWLRLAFFTQQGSPATPQQLEALLRPPASFAEWFRGPGQSLPQDQPIIDRLAVLHDQLHTLARLTLLRASPGQPLAEADFLAVMAKYQALMASLRQLEKAFAVAASGLDLLTGLRSRVGLAEDVLREQKRLARTGHPFCLALMDLDHFKAVNDTYGHDAGDAVLAAAANLVTRTIRAFDDAYRLGGEEFLLVLKETDTTKAQIVLERLRHNLAGADIPVAGRQPIRVTASFGLVAGKVESSLEVLLKAADQALYAAKAGGRNQVRLAE